MRCVSRYLSAAALLVAANSALALDHPYGAPAALAPPANTAPVPHYRSAAYEPTPAAPQAPEAIEPREGVRSETVYGVPGGYNGQAYGGGYSPAGNCGAGGGYAGGTVVEGETSYGGSYGCGYGGGYGDAMGEGNYEYGCGCPWFGSIAGLIMTRDRGNRVFTTFDANNINDQLMNTQDADADKFKA